MHFKQCAGMLYIQKSVGPRWVCWVHHSDGVSHCQECLMLDGCLFLESKAPQCPHHPSCHCTLDPIDYAIVQRIASADSDYSKFDPYLFNTQGKYTHSKEKLFASWGYFVEDARWLQAEMERPAREKYLMGDYKLGRLDQWGQHINIRVEIPKRNGIGNVSFTTGWMVCPDGQIKLNTPYGGK